MAMTFLAGSLEVYQVSFCESKREREKPTAQKKNGGENPSVERLLRVYFGRSSEGKQKNIDVM